MTAMTVFSGNGDVSVSKTLKSGNISERQFTMKEYGVKHGVRGQELKRQYAGYRLERGKAGNASLSGLMAQGVIVAEKVTKRFDKHGRALGLTVGFSLPGRIVDVKGDAMSAAETLSDEQLEAILAKRKAPKA